MHSKLAAHGREETEGWMYVREEDKENNFFLYNIYVYIYTYIKRKYNFYNLKLVQNWIKMSQSFN